MYPAEDPCVSPSGRIYSREAILEYLLKKSKEIKLATKIYEEQQAREKQNVSEALQLAQEMRIKSFEQSNDIVTIGKRKSDEVANTSSEYLEKRKKVIDDTDVAVKLEQLKQVSPWVPQFTPQAEAIQAVAPPPKRPPSPFSGKPLRAKDLIPITLVKENDSDASSGSSTVRFVCPVSRYFIEISAFATVTMMINSRVLYLSLNVEKLSQTRR